METKTEICGNGIFFGGSGNGNGTAISGGSFRFQLIWNFRFMVVLHSQSSRPDM
jgi:hypothetical protein